LILGLKQVVRRQVQLPRGFCEWRPRGCREGREGGEAACHRWPLRRPATRGAGCGDRCWRRRA
jgi:hypothetical protein